MIQTRTIFITMVLLFSASAIQADEESSTEPNYAIGLTAGWVIANGMSLRQYIGDGFWQGTFVGTIDKEIGEEYVDASLSFGYYVNKTRLKKIGGVGVKIVGGIEAFREVSKELAINDNYLYTGLGFGLDFGNAGQRGLLVSLDLTYHAGFKGKELEFTRLQPSPSMGIHYNF